MKLFNLDLHISVIADIKDILHRLYGEKVIITDWNLSGHCFVMGRSPTPVEIITSRSWMAINMEMVAAFQARYDTFLSGFDGFVVAHPNVFVLLYEKYNKPVLVVNSCRHDMPFCMNSVRPDSSSMQNELSGCFKRLQEKGLLTLISNNKADNDYFLSANPGIRTHILPSLCLYTRMIWNPAETSDKFLVYSGTAPSHPLTVHRNALGRYSWSDIMKYRGIIHIQYEASTMSQFEHISSGIPLFYPTPRFLHSLWTSGKTGWHSDYWSHIGKTRPPPSLLHTSNPSFWVERADAYDLKGVYFFDSFEELFRMLETFTDPLYSERQVFINARRASTLDSWKTLVDGIYSDMLLDSGF